MLFSYKKGTVKKQVFYSPDSEDRKKCFRMDDTEPEGVLMYIER